MTLEHARQLGAFIAALICSLLCWLLSGRVVQNMSHINMALPVVIYPKWDKFSKMEKCDKCGKMEKCDKFSKIKNYDKFSNMEKCDKFACRSTIDCAAAL